MDSLPPHQQTSDAGYAQLKQVLQRGEDPTGHKETRVVRDVLESLELCREEELEDATEDAVQQVQLLAAVLRLLTALTPDERRKRLCELDYDTLDLLVEKLEEHWDGLIESTDYYKVRGTQVTAGVVRTLKAASKNKAEFVRVSDYLHVMNIRQQAAARRPPISTRAVARLLGESESKIRRWDKRAKKLGVTPEDWDFERLRQIVKPSKRAPP